MQCIASMATRMLTQLYGDKINTPQQAEDLPPQLMPTVEMRAVQPIPVPVVVHGAPAAESVAPPPPTYPTPTPSPWVQPKPSGFHAMMLGMVAASAVFGGLAMVAMALMWSKAMSTFVFIALLMIGAYLLAAGVAYVAAAKPNLA